jgi:uncharacterized protein YndB with AHSA1/START domain
MTGLVRSLGLVLMCLAATTQGVRAQVGPSGFRVATRVSVRATPAVVYGALVDVGRWWNADHTFSGDATNLSLDPRPGGCFCERLPKGGGVEHMRVVYAAPGETLRMNGGLGPLQGLGVTGSLTIALMPDGGGTSVSLAYAVGGFSEGGFLQLAPAVDGVLVEQMNRLKSYVETGRPAR